MDSTVLLGWLAELEMLATGGGILDALEPGLALARETQAHWRVFATMAAVPLRPPAAEALSPPS